MLRTSRILDIVLVLCAIASTVAVVGRTRMSSDAKNDSVPKRITDAKRDYVTGRRIGPEQAVYKLVVWTDYQCPACKRLEGELDSLRARLGDSLAITYHYFPLDAHRLAFRAAVIAECAGTQDKFEAMHRALFYSRLTGDSISLFPLLAKARISEPAVFSHCMADSAVSRTIQRDLDRAKAIGFGGTPGIEIGDQAYTGGMTAEKIAALLRKATHG